MALLTERNELEFFDLELRDQPIPITPILLQHMLEIKELQTLEGKDKSTLVWNLLLEWNLTVVELRTVLYEERR